MTDINAAIDCRSGLEPVPIALPDTAEAVVVTDAGWRIVGVNPAFTRITGYPEEAVRGRSPRLLLAGRQPPGWCASLRAAVAARGKWSGEVWSRRCDGDTYLGQLAVSTLADGCGQITHYVGVHSDLTQRRSEDELIRQLTEHDPLTGLPNWERLQGMLEEIVAAAGAGGCVALLMVDLDRFRTINEGLGHNIGDYVLQALAERIVRAAGRDTVVARRGGDEFCLVRARISAQAAEREVAALAEALLAAIAEPVRIYGQEFVLTASVGISLYPRDGCTAASLLRYADAATDQAKRDGRNTYRFFTPGMKAAIDERLMLEKGLRQAIERSQLRLHYQPLVDLASGSVAGVEALLRWQHPELGLVAPARFVPLAEESGAILAIGDWVLHEACRQGRAWHDAGYGHLQMAVNLSPLQFKQHHLAEHIVATLDATGFDPACLDLEITESSLMQEPEQAAQLLAQLKRKNIRISVDDFGTGYSSLGYLKHFPLDRLKIDRVFVQDCCTDRHDAAIVDTVISLARNMDLEVVAEGVENLAQLQFLSSRGCDVAQGYLFSPPVPAERFEALFGADCLLAAGDGGGR